MTDIMSRLTAALGDKYAFERELGAGGMATVYLARDLKHDREVAVKVLLPELSASIGGERFEREIRVAGRLQHPHILGMFDSGVADGLLYYVMPFVKGQSLRDRIDNEGQLPIDDALHIILEVLDAIGYAHEQQIIHRDLKPENILLQGGHALVADSGSPGLPKRAEATQTGMSLGTPSYMAPSRGWGRRSAPPPTLRPRLRALRDAGGRAAVQRQELLGDLAKHVMEQVPSIRIVRHRCRRNWSWPSSLRWGSRPPTVPRAAPNGASCWWRPRVATPGPGC